jgi:hypothetical protein
MVDKSPYEKIADFVEFIKNAVNCQSPAKIKKINSDGTVNVEVYRNDEIENQLLIGIKIKHPETGKAFIYLGVEEGDEGVVRYFDRSTVDYIDGKDGYNFDDRCHNTNDACFELGFIPNPRNYVYPVNHDLMIGTKDGKGILTLDTGGVINILGGNVNIGGESSVIVDSSNIKLGGSGSSNNLLTSATVIKDSLGGVCTIVSGTSQKVKAD